MTIDKHAVIYSKQNSGLEGDEYGQKKVYKTKIVALKI